MNDEMEFIDVPPVKGWKQESRAEFWAAVVGLVAFLVIVGFGFLYLINPS